MKANKKKTKAMISGESHKRYRILVDGHVVFVVKVLTEIQYSVLTVECTGSVMV